MVCKQEGGKLFPLQLKMHQGGLSSIGCFTEEVLITYTRLHPETLSAYTLALKYGRRPTVFIPSRNSQSSEQYGLRANKPVQQ